MTEPGDAGGELPRAIAQPERPPRRPFEVGTRATIGILIGALGLGVVGWFATRGGGIADEGGARRGYGDDDRDDDDDDGVVVEGVWGGGGGGGSTDRAIRRMDHLADQLCACADTACSERVMAEMSSMPTPSGKPSKAQMDRAMKIAERMAECQKNLMAIDQPPPELPEEEDEDDDRDEPPQRGQDSDVVLP